MQGELQGKTVKVAGDVVEGSIDRGQYADGVRDQQPGQVPARSGMSAKT